ncbi:MAG: hypothetical protein ABJB76_12965 [Candidatus Nitrosocosmicus sp.]
MDILFFKSAANDGYSMIPLADLVGPYFQTFSITMNSSGIVVVVERYTGISILVFIKKLSYLL